MARPKKELSRILSADEREITFEGSVVGSDRELVSLLLKVADGERHVKTACNLVERFGPLLPSVGEGDGDARVVPMDVIDNVALFAGYVSRLSLTSMGIESDCDVMTMLGDGEWKSEATYLTANGIAVSVNAVTLTNCLEKADAAQMMLTRMMNEVSMRRFVADMRVGLPRETLESSVLFAVVDSAKRGLLAPCPRCSRPVIKVNSMSSPFCSKVCCNAYRKSHV